MAEKTDEITNTIKSAVENLCKCNLLLDVSFLTCDKGGDRTTVIYYSVIYNEKLLQNITTWVKNTDEITVSGTALKINADCPVKVDTITSMKCQSTTTNKSTGSKTASIALPIVLVFVVVMLGLMAGFIYWRRRHGNHSFPRYRFGDIQCNL